jgi:cell division protein FtsZ
MSIAQARQAILEMKGKVDTLIVVSNDKLLQIVPENTPLTDAFLVADDILRQGNTSMKYWSRYSV